MTDTIIAQNGKESKPLCPIGCGHGGCAKMRPSLTNKQIASASVTDLRARVGEIKLAMSFMPRERFAREGWKPDARKWKSETIRIRSELNRRRFEPDLEHDLVEVGREFYNMGVDVNTTAIAAGGGK